MPYNNGVAGLVILALLLTTYPTRVSSALSCTQALTNLMPCHLSVTGVDGVSVPCCQWAQTLSGSAADHKFVCQCLRQAAKPITINQNKAMQLAQLCKINVLFNIQSNMDCDTIAFHDWRSHTNRHKNMEIEPKDFRPTIPGHSPGIGHPPKLGSKWTVTKEIRPTQPGHSPGISHPPVLGYKL